MPHGNQAGIDAVLLHGILVGLSVQSLQTAMGNWILSIFQPSSHDCVHRLQDLLPDHLLVFGLLAARAAHFWLLGLTLRTTGCGLYLSLHHCLHQWQQLCGTAGVRNLLSHNPRMAETGSLCHCSNDMFTKSQAHRVRMLK